MDIIFSKRKYSNILHVNNGGWHFTNIRTPQEIYKKLSKFAHHYEFEESKLNLKDLEKIVKEKKECRPKDVADELGFRKKMLTLKGRKTLARRRKKGRKKLIT